MGQHQPPRGVGRGHRSRSSLTYGDQQALSCDVARALLVYDATLRTDLPRLKLMLRAMFQAGYDLTVTETPLSNGVRTAVADVTRRRPPERRLRDKDQYLHAMLTLGPTTSDEHIQATLLRLFGQSIRPDLIVRARQHALRVHWTHEEATALLEKYKSADVPTLLGERENLEGGSWSLPDVPPARGGASA